MTQKDVRAASAKERAAAQAKIAAKNTANTGHKSRMRRDMEVLTDSSRDPARPTAYDKTARFVAERLQQQGVLPAGDGRSGLKRYLQPFHWKQAFDKGHLSSENVVGIRRGDGSTNEAILIVAHLDGLSAAEKHWYEDKAPKEERVPSMKNYKGANDNASAVAAALHISDEMARVERRTGKLLKRDVVFLFPSGEEDGLKGTEAFAKYSSQFKDKKFVGVVNLEMVGHGELDKVRLFGGKTARSAKANPLYRKAMRLKVDGEIAKLIPGHENDRGEDWWLRSDHFVTAKAGIPSVMYTGDGDHKYHTPDDNLSNIQWKTQTGIAKHAFQLVMSLANSSRVSTKGRRLPVPKNLDTDNPGRVYPGPATK